MEALTDQVYESALIIINEVQGVLVSYMQLYSSSESEFPTL